jgi:antagonist of KipI
LYAHPLGKSPAELAGKIAPVSEVPSLAVTTLRFVPYRGEGSVAGRQLEEASALTYEVGAASDRMGVRLLPEPEGVLAWTGAELTSFGVPRGAIQLPPGGSPVVLGADHQTTGGYPVLGVVIRADWPLLAQLRPGAKVRLQPVSLEEAKAARVNGLYGGRVAER